MVNYKLRMNFQMMLRLFGDREFLPNRGVIEILRKMVCTHEPMGTEICENIVFLIAGFDSAQLNLVRDNLCKIVNSLINYHY